MDCVYSIVEIKKNKYALLANYSDSNEAKVLKYYTEYHVAEKELMQQFKKEQYQLEQLENILCAYLCNDVSELWNDEFSELVQKYLPNLNVKLRTLLGKLQNENKIELRCTVQPYSIIPRNLKPNYASYLTHPEDIDISWMSAYKQQSILNELQPENKAPIENTEEYTTEQSDDCYCSHKWEIAITGVNCEHETIMLDTIYNMFGKECCDLDTESRVVTITTFSNLRDRDETPILIYELFNEWKYRDHVELVHEYYNDKAPTNNTPISITDNADRLECEYSDKTENFIIRGTENTEVVRQLTVTVPMPSYSLLATGKKGVAIMRYDKHDQMWIIVSKHRSHFKALNELWRITNDSRYCPNG